jgi:hypothetical protein
MTTVKLMRHHLPTSSLPAGPLPGWAPGAFDWGPEERPARRAWLFVCAVLAAVRPW